LTREWSSADAGRRPSTTVSYQGRIEPKLVAFTHPVATGVLELLEELCVRTSPPGVLLERDDDFLPDTEITSELDQIQASVRSGEHRRTEACVS